MADIGKISKSSGQTRIGLAQAGSPSSSLFFLSSTKFQAASAGAAPDAPEAPEAPDAREPRVEAAAGAGDAADASQQSFLS